jgi:hypothetical protein
VACLASWAGDGLVRECLRLARTDSEEVQRRFRRAKISGIGILACKCTGLEAYSTVSQRAVFGTLITRPRA